MHIVDRRAVIWSAIATMVTAHSEAFCRAKPPETEIDEALSIALTQADVGDFAAIDRIHARTDLGRATRLLVDAVLASSLLQVDPALRAARRGLALADVTAPYRQRALDVATETAFLAGNFAAASAFATRRLAMSSDAAGEDLAGVRRLASISASLTGIRPHVSNFGPSSSSIPMTRDRIGLFRIPVRIGVGEDEAVIDTGANLSVVSESVADRAGMERLDGRGTIKNALGSQVAVQLAIAQRMRVAGFEMANVPFVVLPDADLRFPVPGGYAMSSIIGLPVMIAMRRISFARSRFAIGGLAIHSAMPNLRVAGSDAYVIAKIAGREGALFVDSGANRTFLGARYARDTPSLVLRKSQTTGRTIGAGSAREDAKAFVDDLTLSLAGQSVLLKSIEIETSGDPDSRLGVLGADVIGMFEGVDLDFSTMRLDVRL